MVAGSTGGVAACVNIDQFFGIAAKSIFRIQIAVTDHKFIFIKNPFNFAIGTDDMDLAQRARGIGGHIVSGNSAVGKVDDNTLAVNLIIVAFPDAAGVRKILLHDFFEPLFVVVQFRIIRMSRPDIGIPGNRMVKVQTAH